MNKLSAFIVKHKALLVGLVGILTVLSIVAMLYVNVNSDILSYLPEGVPMTEGMNFMRENFNMEGDAIVGVSGVDYAQMQGIVSEMEQKLKGVKEGGIIWLGTIRSMAEMDLSGMTDSIPGYIYNLLSQEVKDAIEELGNLDAQAIVDDMMKNESLLNMFFPEREAGEVFDETKKGQYVLMLQLNVAPSSDEAMAIIDVLNDDILKDYDHAIGGSTQITKEIFDSTINEIWKYMIVAVLVMFIILLLTSTSLVEPFVFMLTLGISILLNMGTNLILPSVSVVTFAASAILQLGLSMDYAIFMMHAFDEERRKTLNDELAMQRAIPRTFSTIASSALTTVGGFLALFFMRFEIGGDLGIVLAKGVVLSLLTIIFLQPCMLLLTRKLHDKTEHRLMVPKFKGVASFSTTHRKTIVFLAILLMIPCIVLQGKVDLTYVKFTYDNAEPTAIEQTVDRMSNSVIVILPAGKDTYEKHKEFVAAIEGTEDQPAKVDNVVAIMGLYAMLPEEMAEPMSVVVPVISKFQSFLPPEAAMIGNFVSKDYTMYSIMLDCEAESEEATASLAVIRNLCDTLFETNTEEHTTYYITGMSQAVEDLRAITPRDFQIVSLVSIAFILVILLFTLRSFKLSALLIGVIELGIFINLSISFIIGQAINFMAYIIISSIQLGATVDYAILYTVKYQRYLDMMPAKEAAYKALRDSGVSIITSVAIMAGCCLSVSLVTSNLIVGEITMMIARGSVISGILVMVLLPALLVIFTGNHKLKRPGREEARRVKRLTRKSRKQAVASNPDEGL